MSQENVEVVRQYLAAYSEGGSNALAELWHPEISWRAVEGYLDDAGVIRGPAAMRDYFRQWEETFDEVRVEIEELTDAGDQVVAAVRAVARMKGSDAEVDIRYGVVVWIRDGKIVQGREYATGAEAVKAAGLSDERHLMPPASGDLR